MEDVLQTKLGQVYKQQLIDVFRTFIRICEENNLQYFCCGGTAIGVVRHQGMIPWDDDIDVLMPREDYNLFLKIMTDSCPIKYEIVIPDQFVNYYLPFAKFCLKDSTILEHKDIPCVFGANIDIFPLDGASSDPVNLQENYRCFRRNANKLYAISKSVSGNINAFFSNLFSFQIRTALNELKFIKYKKSGKKKVWENLNQIMNTIPFENAEFVGNYGGMWGLKEFGPKEWFNGYEVGDFEGMKVRLPKHYDKLLTQMYGDYMTPPPIENRKSHHHLVFIDLHKRVSMSEILKHI